MLSRGFPMDMMISLKIQNFHILPMVDTPKKAYLPLILIECLYFQQLKFVYNKDCIKRLFELGFVSKLLSSLGFEFLENGHRRIPKPSDKISLTICM
jgi:hypothetical protein